MCTPNPTDYTMEDWAIEKTKSGARWTWSSLRPPYIIGVNVGSAMNILANIAVYGVFCKVGWCLLQQRAVQVSRSRRA